MGIRGFNKYMTQQVSGSWKTVNILDELAYYQRARGRPPVLIINLWTLVHGNPDLVAGDRINVIEDRFTEFLEKLRDAGAEMVFVFKKTQIINDIETRAGRDEISKLDFSYERTMQKMFILAQVAKRFGQLRGMDSIKNRPSTFQIQLAEELNAFAIMGLNTHYVFYEGTWAFWSDAELNMKSMTIRQFSKERIMQHLNLTSQQAPLFATLAGSLISSDANIARTVNYFRKSRYQDQFMTISAFVNKERFPLTDGSLQLIIQKIFGNCSASVFDDFKRTIRLMDPSEYDKVAVNIDPDIMELVRDDVSNFAEEILVNAPIFISADGSLSACTPSISELTSSFIQKTAGILLKGEETAKTVAVLVTQRSQLSALKLAPTPCTLNVPSAKSVIAGFMPYDLKVDVLLWITGLQLSVDDIESIPNEFIMDIIVCLHLFKFKYLKMWEAECLFEAIVAARQRRDSTSQRRCGGSRSFQILSMHSKIFTVLHSCFAAAGLKFFHSELIYDDVDFQSSYMNKSSAEQKDEDLVPVNVAFQKLRRTLTPRKSDNSGKPEPTDWEDDFDDEGSGDFPDYDKVEQMFAEEQFVLCLRKFKQAEETTKLSNEQRNLKAECLVMLERFQEAEKIVSSNIRRSPEDFNAHYVLGLKFYYEVKMKDCIEKLAAACKINPEFEKAKQRQEIAQKMLDAINQGSHQLKERKATEAIEVFTPALTLDTGNKGFNAFICYNLGIACVELKSYKDAFDHFSKALVNQEKNAQALYRRALCHNQLNEFEDCIIDCEESLKLEDKFDTKKLLSEAKKALKSLRYRSPNVILGIPENASKAVVKKAFYTLSLLYHPDKHPQSTKIEIMKLSRKFREMKAAYDSANNLAK